MARKRRVKRNNVITKMMNAYKAINKGKRKYTTLDMAVLSLLWFMSVVIVLH